MFHPRSIFGRSAGKRRRSFLVACCVGAVSWCAVAHGGSPQTCSPSEAKAPAMPLDDRQILAIYEQANTFDIETGQLGEARGASADVRGLGHMVVSDHTAVREKAARIGRTAGIEPELPGARAAATAEHESKMSELRDLDGAAFDRAYLRHEIRFHTDAIQAVQTVLIPATSNAELKQLMIEVLPGFQHHLDETIRVAKKLGYE